MARLMTESGTWERLRAGRPPPPPDVTAHCRALGAVYELARTASRAAPVASPVPLQRRLLLLQLQRESALRGIRPRDDPR
jgi:hypothetical protein